MRWADRDYESRVLGATWGQLEGFKSRIDCFFMKIESAFSGNP
jgi:hypothetical protein